MKKFLILLCLIFPADAYAQRQTVMNEAEQMGLLAGLASACNADAHVLHDYEEIASRIIANKAPSQAVEDMFVKDYARAKAQFYLKQIKAPEISCGEVMTHFTQMPVFSFKLYDDGTLITNEGKYLYPRGKSGLKKGAVLVYPASAAAVKKTSPKPTAAQAQNTPRAVRPASNIQKNTPVQKQQKRFQPAYK